MCIYTAPSRRSYLDNHHNLKYKLYGYSSLAIDLYVVDIFYRLISNEKEDFVCISIIQVIRLNNSFSKEVHVVDFFYIYIKPLACSSYFSLYSIISNIHIDTFDICIEPCLVEHRYIVSRLYEDERFDFFFLAIQTNSMC
jgi:hypothetical protein